jgi:hypothetical protein
MKKDVTYLYKPMGRTRGYFYGFAGIIGERKTNAEQTAYERFDRAHHSLERSLSYLAGILTVLPKGMIHHEGEKLLLEGDTLLHEFKAGASAIRKMRIHQEAIIRLVGKIEKRGGLVFAKED